METPRWEGSGFMGSTLGVKLAISVLLWEGRPHPRGLKSWWKDGIRLAAICANANVPTFRFRAFSRCFYPKPPAISMFVRRKSNNI